MAYSLETVYEIWDDGSGEHLEVGPDRDSLGLIEIRYFGTEAIVQSSITISVEEAKLVVEALNKAIKDQEIKK